ncbi:ADP-ribose pyrophosphatase YjhB, NUDIX family [Halogranum rubrum]|uniref:ADP-ribose pyrophosphatase YjhB, NUDIX family n=1 Tax=Halogranum rubrum TaxID=553466 RepID=A0A1I4D6T9_9EURY|nr:NUDIX hydrolase [Halogranum rubrum]SFK87701.1 ADP-ribose pyrophosphatase YjhB, NUDIX family [Halogranum rubrum]
MNESARRRLRTEAIDHAATLATDVEDRWGPVADEGSVVVSPLPHDDTTFPESLRAFHEQFYPYAAGCLTRDDDGRILAVESTHRGYWESPGGAGEPDEAPAETARREVREETGITPTVVEPLYRLTMELDLGYDETLPIPVFVFVGEPAEGSVASADAVETPGEVDDVGWFSPSNLPEEFRDRKLVLKHLE